MLFACLDNTLKVLMLPPVDLWYIPNVIVDASEILKISWHLDDIRGLKTLKPSFLIYFIEIYLTPYHV